MTVMNRFVIIAAVVAATAFLALVISVTEADSHVVTATMSVDSTTVQEGETVTAFVTIRTTSPQTPSYLGTIKVNVTPGSAQEADFIAYGINENSQAMCSPCFKPVREGGQSRRTKSSTTSQ